jgi:hypothetical protein
MSPSGDGERSRPETHGELRSYGHLLAVWVLVGWSFAGLGWKLADVVPAALPVSSMSAGAVFGTAVVAGAWAAGVRPPVLPSVAFFLVQPAVHLSLVLGTVFLSPGATLGPWAMVGYDAVSIALVGVPTLTPPGRAALGRLFRRARSSLEPSPGGSEG